MSLECAKLFIKCGDRDVLDFRLLHFKAFVGSIPEADGSYEVRCIDTTAKAANARAEMIESIVKQQGYGEVVRTEPASEEDQS